MYLSRTVDIVERAKGTWITYPKNNVGPGTGVLIGHDGVVHGRQSSNQKTAVSTATHALH